nr:glyoxalase [Trinickia fusca]
MQTRRFGVRSALLAALMFGLAQMPAAFADADAGASTESARAAASAPSVAVGPQYDTTHVYVAQSDLGAFVDSFVATFGGKASPPVTLTVTPTPSETLSQYVQTPVGMLSVFGFKTPIPYPFGAERTGYLVTDLDDAVKAARTDGADIVVDSFDDPIGRDAVVRWPDGVMMQLYWHRKAPSYAPLETVPDNRVYLSQGEANHFVRSWVRFSHGKVVSDNRHEDGGAIGRPGTDVRKIVIDSTFGRVAAFVTDGKLPFPYGREMTGYAVTDLDATLTKAQAAGVKVLVQPYRTPAGRTAMLAFPGGYIAEVHDAK